MTEQAIEFFWPSGPDAPALPGDGNPVPVPEEKSSHARRLGLLAVGAWPAAAILAVAAPFQQLYEIRYTGTDPSQGPNERIIVDGWGRYSGTGLGDVFGARDTRYGIALILCAAVLALLVLPGALPTLGRQ